MDDNAILDLYFARSEQAIKEGANGFPRIHSLLLFAF